VFTKNKNINNRLIKFRTKIKPNNLPGLVLPFVNLEKFEEKNELLLSCSNIEAGFCGFSNIESKQRKIQLILSNS